MTSEKRNTKSVGVAEGFKCECGGVHRPRLHDDDLNRIVGRLDSMNKMYSRLGKEATEYARETRALTLALMNMSPGAHSQRRYNRD